MATSFFHLCRNRKLSLSSHSFTAASISTAFSDFLKSFQSSGGVLPSVSDHLLGHEHSLHPSGKTSVLHACAIEQSGSSILQSKPRNDIFNHDCSELPVLIGRIYRSHGERAVCFSRNSGLSEQLRPSHGTATEPPHNLFTRGVSSHSNLRPAGSNDPRQKWRPSGSKGNRAPFVKPKAPPPVPERKQEEDVSALLEAATWTHLPVHSRPPVITAMGHVDHGKTSLLDALRETSVAAREAGGITQHIGAFVVSMPSGSSLTFLDTPGHAAFSNMRARGAAVTDIVVLVVAADDGVMPQTREAIQHARSAGVPMVVAINKCDKPGANPATVKQQLLEEGLELEEIGGEIQVVEVSAVTKAGLDALEEALLLQAEMMDLKARTNGDAEAIVVEAKLDRGQGPLASVIVRAGTLRAGDHVVVGTQWGRLRALRNMLGDDVASAGPSMPVEILGLKGLPEAGDRLLVVTDEHLARRVSELRQQRAEEARLVKIGGPTPAVAPAPAATLSKKDKKGQKKGRGPAPPPVEEPKATKNGAEGEEKEEEEKIQVEMAVLVKADVHGTAEAVTQAIQGLNSDQVAVNVVHSGVGPILQSDVAFAEATGACIVSFNVRSMAATVEAAAKRAKIEVRQHRIIYHLLEDIGSMIIDKAPGTEEERISGQAEVLKVFEIKGKKSDGIPSTFIAGCRVSEGRLQRVAKVRVLRSGDVMFEGPCKSLKRDKSDVDAVGSGSECGVIVDGFGDYEVGDIVQCVEVLKRRPKLISSQSGMVRIEA